MVLSRTGPVKCLIRIYHLGCYPEASGMFVPHSTRTSCMSLHAKNSSLIMRVSLGSSNISFLWLSLPAKVYSHLLLYSFRKLKLVDPVTMPIHLMHEYLARSNNNYYKGTEIFVGNLLLHSRALNVRPKLLADNPRFRIVTIFSINPLTDRT